jgi:hypothetical protein
MAKSPTSRAMDAIQQAKQDMKLEPQVHVWRKTGANEIFIPQQRHKPAALKS